MRSTIVALVCIVIVLVTIVAFGHWDLREGKRPPVAERFTDNGDGTVTDKTTGLIWLKDANCFGPLTWHEAMTAIEGLANGQCGLTDGSAQGDWRLPERAELLTLLDERYEYPALSNAAGTGSWMEGDPFSGVQSSPYWSATAYKNYPDVAWLGSPHMDQRVSDNALQGGSGLCRVAERGEQIHAEAGRPRWLPLRPITQRPSETHFRLVHHVRVDPGFRRIRLVETRAAEAVERPDHEPFQGRLVPERAHVAGRGRQPVFDDRRAQRKRQRGQRRQQGEQGQVQRHRVGG